ncbi:hypothetical protein BT96DRAFT_920264 [Gymnopus androsaceus JB14]|uniref:Uncharacterized protein n=1 Tax=Gymnopus androsaceus JB14 TaxID=1447944 RepID=A0A6A4HQU5_9AGAR|nr:hypothetical protein BT96DRAFT_920264 [Gymnopus androsaceus JB14]
MIPEFKKLLNCHLGHATVTVCDGRRDGRIGTVPVPSWIFWDRNLPSRFARYGRNYGC